MSIKFNMIVSPGLFYKKNNCNLPKNQPAFSGFINRDKLISTLHLNPMWHFRDFSEEEYSKLTARELRILRKRYSKLSAENHDKYEAIENNHIALAEGMMKRFDALYGKGKYTVIVIGRSLSSVGKVLGYLIGEDNVKNIPMSYAFRFTEDHNYGKKLCNENLAKFINFLQSVGLSKSEVTKTNKHKFILIDYCNSGDSLKGADALLQSDYVFGKRKNFHKENVIATCLEDFVTRGRLTQVMFHSEYKKFAFVKNCHNLAETAKSTISPVWVGKKVKLVWFNLLDKVCRSKIG